MTPAALPFPDISPTVFEVSLGGFGFALHWYAVAYIVALLLAWRILVWLFRRDHLWAGNAAPAAPEKAEDLMTYVILGVVLGGRLGYVAFYQPAYYLRNPAEILALWQGGMSFHGGMLGVAFAVWLFHRRNGAPLGKLLDAGALATPIGLALGRVANFVNAELWGRPTDLPWGVVFPGRAAQDCPGVEGPCARHPSQLYEAGLEGILLLVIVWALALRSGGLKRPGFLTGVFLAGYGLARMAVETVRQADPQYVTVMNPEGYVWQLGGVGLTMGQVLSLPMVLGGLALAIVAWRRGPR